MSRAKRPAASASYWFPGSACEAAALEAPPHEAEPLAQCVPRRSLGTRCAFAGLDLSRLLCMPARSSPDAPNGTGEGVSLPENSGQILPACPKWPDPCKLAGLATACVPRDGLSIRPRNFSEIAVVAEFLPPPAGAADITVTPRLGARRGTCALGQSPPEIEHGEGKGSLCDSEAPHAGSYACCCR
jgi:hypothetical protein